MVNVTLKSGTNALKGQGYYYMRDETLSATDFFVNKSGGEKPALGYDRFGGSLGGPVRFPGYNGRDRTFFFGAIEWLYDEFPEPGPQTVPTEAMRNGDFSALLGAERHHLRSADRARRERLRRALAVPGQHHSRRTASTPSRAQVLGYFPAPNQAGDAQGRNNYFSANPRTDDFYSISTRVDHRLTDKQQLFVRYVRNDRREARGNWSGEVNGIRPIGNYLFRVNDGITYDHVYTMSNVVAASTCAAAGRGSRNRTSGSTKASSISPRWASRRRR